MIVPNSVDGPQPPRGEHHNTFPTRPLLVISVGFYIASLTSEALPGWPGWAMLVFGWLEVGFSNVDSAVAFAWLANPLLFLGWLMGGSSFRLAGCICASSSLLLAVLYIAAGKYVITNEAGIPIPNVHVSVGYIFWVASIALATVRAFLPSGGIVNVSNAGP
jgi:hypothetical protein